MRLTPNPQSLSFFSRFSASCGLGGCNVIITLIGVVISATLFALAIQPTSSLYALAALLLTMRPRKFLQ
jgi:hypothetical protein